MGQVEENNNLNGTSTLTDGQRDFHEANRQYWLSYEGLSSEAYFRQRLFALVNDSRAAYNSGDIARMEKNLERIAWVEPLVQAEPLLSFYETGLVMATLPLADWARDTLDIETAYNLAARCREVLIGKRNRRREMGLGYRPDSECWYKLYSLLANLKWKGLDEHRNRVVTPENLVCDYLKIERRCLKYLDGLPLNDRKENESVYDGLGWCGVQVIKMAARWCPQHVSVLIEDFNNTHGDLLRRQAGHFLDNTPTNARNPWYWDFELYKWCMFGPGTPDEAMLCHQWRLDSTRAVYSARVDLQGVFMGLNNELEFLLNPANQTRATVGS
jgi:hypothetical protein